MQYNILWGATPETRDKIKYYLGPLEADLIDMAPVRELVGFVKMVPIGNCPNCMHCFDEMIVVLEYQSPAYDYFVSITKTCTL
jgi:hypothetical protein